LTIVRAAGVKASGPFLYSCREQIVAHQPIKTFADMTKAPGFQPPAPQWVEWDPLAFRKGILNASTVTFREWLRARVEQLHRERINMDRITVVYSGNRTEVCVDRRVRFEFKMQIRMEGT
jgi:hypothetical protein